MDPVEAEAPSDAELDEMQGQLTAEVMSVETKAAFEDALAYWTPRIRPPMTLRALIRVGKSRGWI